MKTFGLLFGREVAVVAVSRLREGGLSWEERVGQKQVLQNTTRSHCFISENWVVIDKKMKTILKVEEEEEEEEAEEAGWSERQLGEEDENMEGFIKRKKKCA